MSEHFFTDDSFSDDKYIILGKLNAHHGIKGWLKVYSYTDPKQNILSYKQILLLKNSNAIYKQIELDTGRLQGKGVVAHFKGYDSRESAEELIGCTIAIERAELENLAENEYYWIDLIGLEVINQEGINLGKVIKIMPTGANDVLVVRNELEDVAEGLQEEYLIPYIMGQFVLNVDLNAGSMQVDWDIDF
jgi:16S rRNA processing protein RimM